MRLEDMAFDGPPPIDGYGEGGFRIAGAWRAGSLILTPEAILDWPVGELDAASAESLAPLLAIAGHLDVALLGTGAVGGRPARALRDAFEAAELGLEAMDTGAAARTYNVLLAERRRVAAALIAVT